MIKIEHLDTYGWEAAVRGMRNPMNSWEKNDTLGLAKRLVKAGTEHRKFLRQIYVSFDVVAPLYWWKEFDTYKVGTTSNSCSTMHKLTSKPLTIEDFSYDGLLKEDKLLLSMIVRLLEERRDILVQGECMLDEQDSLWRGLILMLPSSYNQRRTITCNMENILNMVLQRKNHKLTEWREFCKHMLKYVPYLNEFEEAANGRLQTKND